MGKLGRIFGAAAVACLVMVGVEARAQLQTVGDGGPGPVKAQHLTAEMTSLTPDVAPGGTVQAGLVLTLEEKWHVYWVNAGDSGEPPHIKWTLPAGIAAGPMQFPIPSRLPLGPLMDFGYEDRVAFPVTISASKTVKPGPVHLDAMVDWLVCREVCIPGKAHLGLNLNVVPGAPPPVPAVGALGQALKQLPQPLPSRMKLTVNGGKQNFVLTLITGDQETDGEFYPYDQEQVANAADQVSEPLPNGLRMRVRRAPELTALPKTLHGLIKLSDQQGYDVTAEVVPGEVAEVPARGPGAKTVAETGAVTAIGAIGLAFVGGIILNLMPCVFPVLFLKGLGLVQTSSSERSKLRMHGLVYTLGILVSFWVIVAVLLLLRAGGSQAGWGFQLQSPTFLALLALGIFFFSLSLAGQFELGLSLTSAGGSLAEKQGYTGSFFTGVLATVVATPCTAPLMGAAVGFALAQPAWMSFAVFTALGLGLALPYVLLTAQPAWTRWLPKPGAWMEVLKQLTAVPLFATVIWLTWVYGRLFASGGDAGVAMDRVSRLMVGFLLLAIAGWVLGRWPAKRWGTVAAVVLGIAALAAPLYVRQDRTLVWQPFSEQAVQQARASGHPVFIDYTAAWCLSCQVNERLVLRSDDVQREFRSRNVTLMKADWTKYDAAITASLASVGRSGVPTYVIYAANSGSKPEVLPELLSKNIVLAALRNDAR